MFQRLYSAVIYLIYSMEKQFFFPPSLYLFLLWVFHDFRLVGIVSLSLMGPVWIQLKSSVCVYRHQC